MDGDVSGGYILRHEGGGKGPEVVDGVMYTQDFVTASGLVYTYHYPSAAKLSAEQSAYLPAYMQDFEAALAMQPGDYANWIDVGSWVGVLGAQCAGFVGVGAPAIGGVVVDRDGDLGDGFAVSQERGAAEGFIAGESDGNEVQAGLGQGDASVGGDVQDCPGNAGSWSGDHHGGGRATGLGVHEVEELLAAGIDVLSTLNVQSTIDAAVWSSGNDIGGTTLVDDSAQIWCSSESNVAGTVQIRVVRSSQTNYIHYYWRISQVNTGFVVERLTVGNFGSGWLDAHYRPDGVGDDLVRMYGALMASE